MKTVFKVSFCLISS